MLFFTVSAYAQTDNPAGFSIGVNYGGAVPTEMDTADYGAGIPGALAGLKYRIPINKKISLEPSLFYSFRQFKYGTVQKNDTVVDVDVMGNGNYVKVPTYYTANIKGRAITHQFDIQLPLNWKIQNRIAAHAGIYGSYIFTGKDKATATVQIGEGSIIDDIVETSNAFDYINRFEFGLMLGGSFYFNPELKISLEGIRALTPYYSDGYYAELNEGKEVKFYQTYGILRLSYYFLTLN